MNKTQQTKLRPAITTILIDEFGVHNLEAVDKILALVAQAVLQGKIELRNSFIREFTNDHDPSKPPRWLRGVALDEEHLLELILEWFNREAGSK